jgi:hypothetical protein
MSHNSLVAISKPLGVIQVEFRAHRRGREEPVAAHSYHLNTA